MCTQGRWNDLRTTTPGHAVTHSRSRPLRRYRCVRSETPSARSPLHRGPAATDASIRGSGDLGRAASRRCRSPRIADHGDLPSAVPVGAVSAFDGWEAALAGEDAHPNSGATQDAGGFLGGDPVATVGIGAPGGGAGLAALAGSSRALHGSLPVRAALGEFLDIGAEEGWDKVIARAVDPECAAGDHRVNAALGAAQDPRGPGTGDPSQLLRHTTGLPHSEPNPPQAGAVLWIADDAGNGALLHRCEE